MQNPASLFVSFFCPHSFFQHQKYRFCFIPSSNWSMPSKRLKEQGEWKWGLLHSDFVLDFMSAQSKIYKIAELWWVFWRCSGVYQGGLLSQATVCLGRTCLSWLSLSTQHGGLDFWLSLHLYLETLKHFPPNTSSHLIIENYIVPIGPQGFLPRKFLRHNLPTVLLANNGTTCYSWKTVKILKKLKNPSYI